jgi:hypothetical protein
MHFLPLKRYKIALTTIWKQILMNITGIFYLIWHKFWFPQNLRNTLSSKVLYWLGSGAGSASGSVLNQSGSTTLILRYWYLVPIHAVGRVGNINKYASAVNGPTYRC